MKRSNFNNERLIVPTDFTASTPEVSSKLIRVTTSAFLNLSRQSKEANVSVKPDTQGNSWYCESHAYYLLIKLIYNVYFFPSSCAPVTLWIKCPFSWTWQNPLDYWNKTAPLSGTWRHTLRSSRVPQSMARSQSKPTGHKGAEEGKSSRQDVTSWKCVQKESSQCCIRPLLGEVCYNRAVCL